MPMRNTQHCCAPNCKNIYYLSGRDPTCRNRSFFRVTEGREMSWIESIRKLSKPEFSLRIRNNFICEDHFELKCFKNAEKNSLNKNAVPTIFSGSNIDPSSFNSLDLDSNICLKTTLQSVKEFVDETLQNAEKGKCQTSISDDFPEPSFKKPKYIYSKVSSVNTTMRTTTTAIVDTMADEAKSNTGCNINVREDLIDDKQCFNSVEARSNFIKSCVEMEEKIKSGIGFDDPFMVSVSDLCVKVEDSLIKQEENEYKEDWMETEFAVETLKREDQYEVKTECIDIKSEDNESEAIHRSTAHKPTSKTQMYECNYFDNETINKSDLTNRIVTLDGSTVLDPEENSIKHEEILMHKVSPDMQVYIKSEEHNEGEAIHRNTAQTPTSKAQKYECNYFDDKTINRSDVTNHIVTPDGSTVLDPEENSIKHEEILMHKESSDMQVYIKSEEHNEGETIHSPTHETISVPEMNKHPYSDHKTINKSGSRKSRVSLHRRTPPGKSNERITPKIHQCGKCNYNTKYKSNIVQHRITHMDPSQVQMYQCDLCSFTTKYRSNIGPHRLIHKNLGQVKIYECDTCDFKTKSKWSFSTHQLRHMNPRKVEMYTCELCSYESRFMDNLKRHQLRHKGPTQVLMYRCNKCDFKTKYYQSNFKHQQTHANASKRETYRCDKCSFASKSKKCFDDHRLAHEDPSQVQLFKCDDCSYETRYRNDLRVHQLKHNDPSQVCMYLCAQCDFRTKDNRSMRLHQLRHTDPPKEGEEMT